MSKRPKSPCRSPGCPALTDGHYCDAHRQQRRRDDRDRGSACHRGYDRAWRRLRAEVLREQPICASPGCGREATEVDHATSKARGGSDDRDNLRGLCKACHSRKTVMVDGGFCR